MVVVVTRRVPMTRGATLRSRAKGNFQARFWNSGGRGDSPADCRKLSDQLLPGWGPGAFVELMLLEFAPEGGAANAQHLRRSRILLVAPLQCLEDMRLLDLCQSVCPRQCQRRPEGRAGSNMRRQVGGPRARA